MPHLKSVEQGNIEALHRAALTVESGLRCSMCQASLIDSDKPPMYIWRLRVAHILPFCFTLGQVCFWISLWLWYPFSFSTQLTVNEERLCTLYIKVLTADHLWATEWWDWMFRYWSVCVWLFYSLYYMMFANQWSCQYPDWIRGCPSRWADHPGPLLYHGKLHGGIYILCIV